ncbi:MAG: hypothetical protein HYR84_13260 [Planctomycetes bacterium]|nr:hypothetical protein [Planctomycetota bacterium]
MHRTSHWRVLWSPVGQGHVLFIESPLAGKTPRIYADNRSQESEVRSQRSEVRGQES